MHEHWKAERTLTTRLLTSLCLNAAIALAEIIAGVFSGSVALIADATHNLGDVFALALSFLARTLSSRPPSFRHTYGLKRFEVLAAFLNAVVLIVVAVFIVKYALSRLFHPEPVQAGVTALVASMALVANGASVLLLRHHDPHDLNVRSAFFHLLQDVLSSLIVLISAALARTHFGSRLDPIAAMIIGVAVLIGAFSIIRQTFATLLEGVPDGIRVQSVVESVEQRFSAVAMHHVHVWQVGPSQRALTAHLLVRNMDVAEAEVLCNDIRSHLKEKWGIQHVTLEPEVKGCGSETVLGTWNAVFDDGD
ncbi:MAG: cation diffusion facilitator family transporter [Candidatus Sulfotelmatobacter sp.]